MTVRIEKSGPVTTVIHSRPEARNAMDPDGRCADPGLSCVRCRPGRALPCCIGEGGAFCAGWDLKYGSHAQVATARFGISIFPGRRRQCGEPRGPLGPTRWNLTSRSLRPLPACRGGRDGARPVVRFRVMEEDSLFRRLLPPLGSAVAGWWNGAPAPHGRTRPGAGDHPDRPQGARGGVPADRPARKSCRSAPLGARPVACDEIARRSTSLRAGRPPIGLSAAWA